MTQNCTQLQELFEVEQNIATWDNLPELHEKIKYYMENPIERQKITKAAQIHCL